ncbi:MAG TPA: MMPL family transporter [Conexibacter sp.]|jgi:hydrophobe/amphiphile efflux-3 (HAE3) family protein|nr:MMPL family transporter [Conexibacter sp.]
MAVRDWLERVARAAAGRPLPVLLAVAALALGGGLLALRLEPSTGADTLASRSSDAFRTTDELHRRFGDDAVVVLIDERVADLVLTADLGRTIRLEGCLGGNVPRGAKPYGGAGSPCAGLARLKPVRLVYGPGTFLNESVRAVQNAVTAQLRQLQQQVAAAPAAQRAQAQAQATDELKRLVLSSGIQGVPQIDDKPFISQIVFDPARGADVPKARFAALFPSRTAALIQLRLRPDLTAGDRSQAIALIRQAVRMPLFASQHGGSYTVSGVPVVSDALASSVTGGIAVLLIVAVAAMALALLLLFRARLRLLPLLVALAAAAMTFGAMALVGAGLTMASIAVLPVLIGLAVDYAIQFQSRVEEQHEAVPPAPERAEAVARAARAGAPTIATAALATAVGFLVLLLSPIPMVRGFGVLLVVGIALAFACALTAGSAALALPPLRAGALPAPLATAGRAVGSALAGARELLAGAAGVARRRPAHGAQARPRTGRSAPLSAVLGASLRRPGRVLAVALVLALGGWVADTQTRVVSDVRQLVPADLPALRDLNTLQDKTASSGEIDVLVQGADVARPAVVHWMANYQQRVLRRFGYDEERGCRTATLCPAFSLPDLLQGSDARTNAAIDKLLAAVPPYFSQAVLTPRRDAATLAFGIRLMDLQDQQRVIEAMRAELDPPAGVHARLGGLPVVAAQANAELASPWRRLLTLVAGLLAVGLVLLAVFRRVERALVPLVPIALATGWSALVLFATRVPLNPMSATLGALVIAISTEFAVLLSERFRQERTDAGDPALEAALARTYRSTGRAVLASGVTAIAGFGVLAVSDFRMLRDFGIVTVVDLTVSLLGVLAVLPSVLVLAERGAPQRLVRAGGLRVRGWRLPGRGRGGGRTAERGSSAPVA